MSKILLVGDVHLSDKPPSSCTDSYLDDLFDLLAQIADMSGDYAAVVQAGDLFHHKNPLRTSHRTIGRFVDWLETVKCPFYVVPGNHDMCVPEDTEALTDRGWLRYADLDGTERFATLNQDTGAFEWQRPSAVFVLPDYDGEVIRFENDRMEQVVTPNHDMWVTTRSRRTGYGSFRKEKASSLAGRKAQDVVRFKLAADSWEGVAESVVRVPANRRGAGALELPVLLAAELFGWYVSEGSSEPWRVVLSQSKTVHPEHYARIVELVKSLGFIPRLSPKTVRIGSAALSDFLSENFGEVSHEKRIPRFVKDWPRDLLQVFLSAYLAGDGSPNGNGWSARTNSERLADDLQEVAVKLGLASLKGRPFLSDYDDGVSRYEGSRPLFNVGFTSSALTGNSTVTRQLYKGLVWCPSLPNGIWMQRRNGRACWTGNSNDRFDSVFDGQPLGVVLRAGAKLLRGWSDFPDIPLYGVPWLAEWNHRDPETGEHSEAAHDAVGQALKGWTVRRLMREYYATKPCLIVTHAPFYPLGMELPYEYYPTSRFAEEAGPNTSVYYGHVHEAHGIYTSNGATFANMGALSRGSLAEYDVKRAINVTSWDSETGLFTVVPLTYRPAEEVFRLVEAKEVKAKQVALDEFLASIGQTSIEVTNVESVIAAVRGMGLKPEVENIIRKLLEDS